MFLGLSSSLKHENAKDWAAKHKSLGCKAVVFPIDCHAPKQEIREYTEAAAEAGLSIAEVGVWRNVISPDEEQRKAAIDFAIGQLALADEINARCAVNIAGAATSVIWDGAYRENFEAEAWNKTVESVRYIIDAVKPTHTFYSLEPMPWMIPTGPQEYLKLLSDINRSKAGVHIDIVNMINCPERFFFQERFMDECFNLLHGRICSCHLKDIRLRREYTFQLEETACGNGSLNIEHYASLVSAEDPTMPLIIEHLNTDEEYLQSLSYIQNRLGL